MSAIRYLELSKEPLQPSCESRALPRFPTIWKIDRRFQALQWTWDSLSAALANAHVRPLVSLPRSGAYDRDYRSYAREMSFPDFVKLVEAKPEFPCYLAYLRPGDLGAQFAGEADFSFLNLQADDGTDTRIWLGSAGTNSGMHTDLRDNVFVQIHGRKIIYLASPKDTKFLYPYQDNIVNSQINFADIDYERFPKVSRARIYKATIEPGDAVYIPRGWWHCLISLEDSISANHWFGPPVTDAQYISLIREQGVLYSLRMILDLLKYGVVRAKPKNNFFFTPPPNGARLYSYLMHGRFSLDNDPVQEKSCN